MNNKLTLVTTTNRIDGWFDYCRHIKDLQYIHGNKFDVLILDNSSKATFELKKNMLFDHLEKNGSKTINMLHYDTFVECRNQQRFKVETPFLTILDDDDRMCDGFLYIFEFIIDALGYNADYVNLSKIKYGLGEYPYKFLTLLNPMVKENERKLECFYDYDNYDEDRLTKVYPINGYCILSTELYKNCGETIEHYVDDCYPMMKCYLECKHGFKVGLPWQYYKVQNRFMTDYKDLDNCDGSFSRQIRKLVDEYPNNSIVLKQLDNVIKSLSVPLPKFKVHEIYKPKQLLSLKESLK